jgi:hypothetical protein
MVQLEAKKEAAEGKVLWKEILRRAADSDRQEREEAAMQQKIVVTRLQLVVEAPVFAAVAKVEEAQNS